MPAVRQDVKVEMADKKRAENRLDAKLLKPQSVAPGGISSKVEDSLLGGCRIIRAEVKIRKFEDRFWLI